MGPWKTACHRRQVNVFPNGVFIYEAHLFHHPPHQTAAGRPHPRLTRRLFDFTRRLANQHQARRNAACNHRNGPVRVHASSASEYARLQSLERLAALGVTSESHLQVRS
jgi:hypothetical protein